MLKITYTLLFVTVIAAVPAFAIDGTVLINQATVIAAGGFPYKITQPGSYKLSSNLIVPANSDGIDVETSDVTLDLNGFSIVGAINCDLSGTNCSAAPTVATYGVTALAFGVAVRNGHVRGFSRGIKIFGGLVEEIHASGNLIDGIEANDSIIRRNDVSRNHAIGIQAFNSVVTENIASQNISDGFNMGGGGVFGSNAFKSVLGSHISLTSAVVSQHNSSCDGFAC